MKATAQVLTLLLGTAALLSGCVYKVPLTEAYSIPIDEEVLGTWIAEEDIGKSEDDLNGLHVLRFSPTEYLIFVKDNQLDDLVILRGYPIEIGGLSLVQIELPYSPECDEDIRFHVVCYGIKEQRLYLSMLNKNVVSENIQTREELRRAFLENLNHPELFNNSSTYVREKLTGGAK